jgi:hypothetical protein
MWTLIKEQERKLTTCEMRDHLRNVDITRAVGTTPFV